MLLFDSDPKKRFASALALHEAEWLKMQAKAVIDSRGLHERIGDATKHFIG